MKRILDATGPLPAELAFPTAVRIYAARVLALLLVAGIAFMPFIALWLSGPQPRPYSLLAFAVVVVTDVVVLILVYTRLLRLPILFISHKPTSRWQSTAAILRTRDATEKTLLTALSQDLMRRVFPDRLGALQRGLDWFFNRPELVPLRVSRRQDALGRAFGGGALARTSEVQVISYSLKVLILLDAYSDGSASYAEAGKQFATLPEAGRLLTESARELGHSPQDAARFADAMLAILSTGHTG